jgi:DNA processing protein
MRSDLLYYIALTKVPKIGPVIAKNLISYCGSAEAIFMESAEKLEKIPGIGNTLSGSILRSDTLKLAEKELEFAFKNDIKILTFHDAAFPRRLSYFESCPIVIYTKGNTDFNHHRTVAVVGTRTPTENGRIFCEKLIEGLIQYNVLLVSGLAFGVDATAHKSCVANKVATLGVLGHGLDRIYPQQHQSLAAKMMSNGGIMTEFTQGTLPDKENFPMRNRIIAAMSDVVVVIESKRKGGSIITAEFANEYNKDVFAVPGRVTDEFSEGCNKLIKQNKAHLIESVADIAYIMRWEEIDTGKNIQASLFVELDETEQKIVDIIRVSKEISIDNLTYKLNIPPSEVSSLLLTMEFKGIVRSLPGKKYIIC